MDGRLYQINNETQKIINYKKLNIDIPNDFESDSKFVNELVSNVFEREEFKKPDLDKAKIKFVESKQFNFNQTKRSKGEIHQTIFFFNYSVVP